MAKAKKQYYETVLEQELIKGTPRQKVTMYLSSTRLTVMLPLPQKEIKGLTLLNLRTLTHWIRLKKLLVLTRGK